MNTVTIGVIAGFVGLISTVAGLVSCLAIIKCSRSKLSGCCTGQLALEPGPIYEDIQPHTHMWKNECSLTEVNKTFIVLSNNDAYTI